ncbi:acyltransferase [Dyadobacter sp. CY345]|uniref:acyltransferase family protein n=1 Tax=Dyadobacter sp. CY345 TaxID=2909335 RepID=UPI001F3FFF44|nr:acyltransferase [Dyadobacter sp. CY345]MCF2446803.1 acyltransferase [Dyadobacter sp. CY345]
MKINTNRFPWVDNLRGFITLLVVAHHSSLAYTTFAFFDKQAYNASTHPIVDKIRWIGMDIFEDFNDIFFMSLMFLISGIFVMNGLGKGVKNFIRDRFFRLFIPFLTGVSVLMLLAYYPAYLLAYGKNDVKLYIVDYFTTEGWPVGPPWFIWVLFFFNLIIALSFPLLKTNVQKSGIILSLLKSRPFKIILNLYLISWFLYIPLLLWAGPGTWTGIGPFDFQVSRVLLYFGYFSFGLIIGSVNLNEGIFSIDSAFLKKWPVWVIGCVITYAFLKLSETPLKHLVETKQIPLLPVFLLYRSIWILSCVLSCVAFLTFFRQFLNATNTWWNSLSANAYGIYLLHYIFVLWTQYLLLNLELPVILKFVITFSVSVILSWIATYFLKKLRFIGKYL